MCAALPGQDYQHYSSSPVSDAASGSGKRVGRDNTVGLLGRELKVEMKFLLESTCCNSLVVNNKNNDNNMKVITDLILAKL